MNAESKAKILHAIDQAVEYCQEAAVATDDVAERIRLQQLHQSLSRQRVQVACVEENYPSDTDFRMEMTRIEPISYVISTISAVESVLTDSVPQLSDASSIARFSSLVSQLIELERK
jgi:hypothetical protein